MGNVRLIINAPTEHVADLAALMLRELPTFERHDRIGCGWMFVIQGSTYFLRRIKGGVSAAPAKR